MAYNHQTYFPGPQAYSQFIGVPPLTPSNSVPSPDFNTASPLAESFEQFPNPLPTDAYQNFDNAYGQFNGQPYFPGPPTPPGPGGQQVAQSVNGTVVGHPAFTTTDHSSLSKLEAEEQSLRQGSNSEEEGELTPAQIRRRNQNRAAQQKFRARKEARVRELEEALEQALKQKDANASKIEKLNHALREMNTENEILRVRATAAAGANATAPGATAPAMTTGPMSYNPTDFYAQVLEGHDNKVPSHRVAHMGGERLLAAGAAWELIINNDLFKRGLVDVAQVSEELKTKAKCDGQGPVFGERTILEIINRCVASGSDELI